MAEQGRMDVSIRDASLMKRVQRERRARKDKSLSKTLADLARERLAIQDFVGAGTRIDVINGRLVTGAHVDVTG